MKVTPYALLINDIHVSKDNITEFRKNWNEALNICQQQRIPYLIIGGDLWQSRSAQTLDTLMAVREAILTATKQYDLNIIIAEGNHCKVNQEQYEGYSHIFSDYEYVEVVNESSRLDISDTACLWIMSYFPENGSFTERLNSVKSHLDSDRTNLLYIHEGIKGGLSTPSDNEVPANIFSDFDAVLVGHYHDRKKIPGTKIEYIGSSRQHNFGEDEEKGYTILYTNGSTKFIKNEVNQRYKVIDVNISEMNEDLMDMLADIKSDPRYKVKVRIKCDSTQSSSVDKAKLSECGVTKIELVTEQTTVTNVDNSVITQKFDKAGIKQKYTDFCLQKSIDSQLGLYYLEKIH